jgi:hypothetical protein
MTNLINTFMTSPLHIQGLLIFWCVCVVLFYSSIIYGVGGVLVNLFKKNYSND